MILVERGKLSLSDSVANYLPPFADMHVAIEKRDPQSDAMEIALERASRPITIQDLLRHTAGMISASLPWRTALHQQYIEAGVEGEDQTLAERVEKLARLPLAYHPGTVWEYSVSVDVIGRVIEGHLGHAARPLRRCERYRPAQDDGYRLLRSRA
jgi:CubicO group peptidase (beta-lactamase class C family)